MYHEYFKDLSDYSNYVDGTKIASEREREFWLSHRLPGLAGRSGLNRGPCIICEPKRKYWTIHWIAAVGFPKADIKLCWPRSRSLSIDSSARYSSGIPGELGFVGASFNCNGCLRSGLGLSPLVLAGSSGSSSRVRRCRSASSTNERLGETQRAGWTLVWKCLRQMRVFQAKAHTGMGFFGSRTSAETLKQSNIWQHVQDSSVRCCCFFFLVLFCLFFSFSSFLFCVFIIDI